MSRGRLDPNFASKFRHSAWKTEADRPTGDAMSFLA